MYFVIRNILLSKKIIILRANTPNTSKCYILETALNILSEKNAARNVSL